MSTQDHSPSGWPVACQRAGCPRPGTRVCVYVDRRSRACATRWCVEHSVEMRDKTFCVRHASTVNAVGEDALALGQLPELDNRVPSLVFWVGRDLDEDIPLLLAGLVDRAAGQKVVADDVTLIPGGGRISDRRWERSWKVVSHTGILHKVTVQVLEGSPVDVVVRVGRGVVAKEMPPWIAAREAGRPLGPAEDAEGRRAFYRRLHNAISEGLAADADGP